MPKRWGASSALEGGARRESSPDSDHQNRQRRRRGGEERRGDFERFHELRFGSLAALPPRRLPPPSWRQTHPPWRWHCVAAAAAAVGQSLGGWLRRARGRSARCRHELAANFCEIGGETKTIHFSQLDDLKTSLFTRLIHSCSHTTSLPHRAGREAAPEPAGAQISPFHATG